MLGDLFVKYGTDKGVWGYTPYYEKLMEERRHKVTRVLEIGICGHRDIPNNVVGASLFVWREYFPNAHIYGVDIDSRFVFNDQDRIHTACCDAYDPSALSRALSAFGNIPFDFIVDDAVHDPLPQIQLMNQLGDHLVPDGRYFMEDVCPYKVPNGDLDRHFYDHIRGFSEVAAGSTPKPEVLIMGIK